VQDVNAVWLKGIISVVSHTTQSILIASWWSWIHYVLYQHGWE